MSRELKNITIGKVGKSHGVRGEVKIIPLTDDLNRFKALKYVIIDGKEYKVQGCKLQSERAILKLEGFDNPESLVAIRDSYVEVKSQDAVKKRRGEYFIAELVGLTVMDTEGTKLGEIFDVIKTGSNDVYWIKEPELLIPAIKSVIKEINIEEGKMIIEPTRVWNYED